MIPSIVKIPSIPSIPLTQRFRRSQEFFWNKILKMWLVFVWESSAFELAVLHEGLRKLLYLRLWLCILNANPLCSFQCICMPYWPIHTFTLQFCDAG
jgi:hypothetical protein